PEGNVVTVWGNSMSENEKIRVRRGLSAHLSWGAGLFFIYVFTASMIGVLGPKNLQMFLGELPVKIPEFVMFPLAMAMFVMMALFFTLATPKGLRPTTFTSSYIKRRGRAYLWESVSRIYLNPNEKYIVFLLDEQLLWTGARAGFKIRKSRIEPSLEALLNLAKEQSVDIEPNEVLLGKGIADIEHMLEEYYGG
ncbi:MAG: hypothetical protein KAW09_11295, partial [Thermoplasmata archaeon]|nr:hypothetical protein [Thermoplasmata archaeon]